MESSTLLETLLETARSLPQDRREAFLQSRCGDDPDLLRQARTRLRDDDPTVQTPPPEDPTAQSPRSGDTQAPSSASRQRLDPLIGQTLDGYTILDVLGRGGMGVVYKARNDTLDRIEALKMMAPAMTEDAEFLRRFMIEARALAQIQHPNIVTIYAMRESDYGAYITMEYVQGRTIDQVLKAHGPLPWRDALPLVRQLLKAFDYAHGRGILHRDIKPHNIMLTDEDAVKVMDFGLAKFYQRGDVTQTAGISGTLRYMSPEQLMGKASIDQRSDIFSLGTTLYQLFTGRFPFDARSAFAIQQAIIEEPSPPPHHVYRALPPGLSKIILKALEKKPERRFQHVAEMLKAFDTLRQEASAPNAAPPPRMPEPPPRQPSAPSVREAPPPSSRQTAPTAASQPRPARVWRLAVAGLALVSAVAWGAVTRGPDLLARLQGAPDASTELIPERLAAGSLPDNEGTTTDEETADTEPSPSGTRIDPSSTAPTTLTPGGEPETEATDTDEANTAEEDAGSLPSGRTDPSSAEDPVPPISTPAGETNAATTETATETARRPGNEAGAVRGETGVPETAPPENGTGDATDATREPTPPGNTDATDTGPTEAGATDTDATDADTAGPDAPTASDPAPGSGATGETGTGGAETPPATIAPAVLVPAEADRLFGVLRRAILDNSWGDVPAPLTDAYRPQTDELRKFFTIRQVELVQSPPNGAGPVILPVRMTIHYTQQGRDVEQPLLLSARWTWIQAGASVALQGVQIGE